MKLRDLHAKALAQTQDTGMETAASPQSSAIIPESPQSNPCGQEQAGDPPAGTRAFLSRPLGQEDNPDARDAWAPFLNWLSAHHPDRFTAICEAEEALRALERQGITDGQEYEHACAELCRRFDEGRRLRFREAVKV